MGTETEGIDYNAMLAGATCTERVITVAPPFGPDPSFLRVEMLPGAGTVETTLNIMLFQRGNLPQLSDPDFVISGPVLASLLVRLGNEEVTFRRVRTHPPTNGACITHIHPGKGHTHKCTTCPTDLSCAGPRCQQQCALPFRIGPRW